MGTLYMVATPIGNLADISVRALDTLKSVAVIYCEDTRRTGILRARYDIPTPLRSCHAHNERRIVPALLAQLAAGHSVAYVSDAGTPTISDPGLRLASAARAAGWAVVPIPGASAVHALISASGEAGHPYLFYGFLPRGAQRRERTLSDLLVLPYAFVLFESPYRVVGLCRLLHRVSPHRAVVIGRELTKAFEEIRVGTAGEHAAYFAQKKVYGEFSILVTNRKL